MKEVIESRRREVLQIIAEYHQQLPINDYRGRSVGGQCLILKTEYLETAINQNSYCVYTVKPGIYFEAKVQKTKNGKTFGSSQQCSLFNTEDEAKKYIAKRIRGIYIDTEKDNVKRGTNSGVEHCEAGL